MSDFQHNLWFSSLSSLSHTLLSILMHRAVRNQNPSNNEKDKSKENKIHDTKDVTVAGVRGPSTTVGTRAVGPDGDESSQRSQRRSQRAIKRKKFDDEVVSTEPGVVSATAASLSSIITPSTDEIPHPQVQLTSNIWDFRRIRLTIKKASLCNDIKMFAVALFVF